MREQFGTPCYVYDEASLVANAEAAVGTDTHNNHSELPACPLSRLPSVWSGCLGFPNAFGLHARFAMKVRCIPLPITRVERQAVTLR